MTAASSDTTQDQSVPADIQISSAIYATDVFTEATECLVYHAVKPKQ